MALKSLSLDVIPGLMEQVSEAMRRVIDDVAARDLVTKPRKIEICIEITPSVDSGSGKNRPTIESRVKTSVPGYKTGRLIGVINRDGALLIDDESEDALQMALPNVTKIKEATQ